VKKSISGIRGIVGKDFTLKDVLKFCRNFSTLIDSKKCIIANDTRPSGNLIRETTSAVLLSCGIDVYDLGMNPTPVVFREVRKYGGAGIVITASHNPLEWNGLKFIINGRGLNQNELDLVIGEQPISESDIGTENKINSNYVTEATNLIGKIDEEVNVTIDIGGGAAKNVAPELLKEVGCKVKTINDTLNENTRGPDPTTDNLDHLKSITNEKSIGFAFDLDGDRLVVVKDGKKQAPDVTVGLGVFKALELGHRKFIFSVDTSIGIEKFVTERGGIVQRSKVGEANVIELLLKTESHAGGEGSSGGFILPEFNYCRDGILTSGLIATISENHITEILNFLEKYHQIREKTMIPVQYHDQVIEKLYDKMKKDYSDFDLMDGIKAIVDEESWVLIRKSNTEDIIRISSESSNFEKVHNIQQNTKELVKQCYEQIK